MADALFSEPRLAELYDPLDPDRSDLDVYAAMAAEFGAETVVDLGCGTGTLACLLARRGLAVTGADPAAASLEVARRKPGADRVRPAWSLTRSGTHPTGPGSNSSSSPASRPDHRPAAIPRARLLPWTRR